MKQFLLKFLLFLVPLIIAFGIVEYNIRNNTFNAKNTYIEANKDSIEVLVLGSSQNWRAINPRYLSYKTAPLAHGESAMNIDFLLFDKYINELPKLKVVIFELGYHNLEEKRDGNWNKNNLYKIFYNVNNYDKRQPLKDYFLLSSNFKEYIRIFFTAQAERRNGIFNEYGFIEDESNSRFKQLHFDTALIRKTSMNEYLSGRHQYESEVWYQENLIKLNAAIKKCRERNIKIVLLSPPKYYLYNQYMKLNKVKRRENALKKFAGQKDIYILNYEREYEYQADMFKNEDHMSLYGAEQFTVKLDSILKTIIPPQPNKK